MLIYPGYLHKYRKNDSLHIDLLTSALQEVFIKNLKVHSSEPVEDETPN